MGGGRRPAALLFVLDAGGGHRAAANALLAAAEEERSTLQLDVVNLQDVLAAFDLARPILGRSMEETYNAMIRARFTGGLVPMLRLFQWGIRRLHGRLTREVAAFLATRQPALVVSLIPNFNAVLRDAVRRSLPAARFVVVVTDFADFPPHFWMEPGVDGVIVGSARAVEQAREIGLPRERICRTSGMLLHPRFHAAQEPRLGERVRAELGVPQEAFCVLLLFGGKGSPEMRPLAEALLKESDQWHVVAICGDNARLSDAFAADEERWQGRLHRIGFTTRVADFLAAADVLVTKPGPASLAEAFHRRVPVVVACNGHTIPQERYNARLIEEGGLGLVVRSWRQMPAAVRRLAEDAELASRVRRALLALPDNRAVYEVLTFLATQAGDSAASVTMTGAWK
jgi:glycosyltransferase involved in cell wall biosynthesis